MELEDYKQRMYEILGESPDEAGNVALKFDCETPRKIRLHIKRLALMKRKIRHLLLEMDPYAPRSTQQAYGALAERMRSVVFQLEGAKLQLEEKLLDHEGRQSG